jgi:hypothetical protein
LYQCGSAVAAGAGAATGADSTVSRMGGVAGAGARAAMSGACPVYRK